MPATICSVLLLLNMRNHEQEEEAGGDKRHRSKLSNGGADSEVEWMTVLQREEVQGSPTVERQKQLHRAIQPEDETPLPSSPFHQTSLFQQTETVKEKRKLTACMVQPRGQETHKRAIEQSMWMWRTCRSNINTQTIWLLLIISIRHQQQQQQQQ